MSLILVQHQEVNNEWDCIWESRPARSLVKKETGVNERRSVGSASNLDSGIFTRHNGKKINNNEVYSSPTGRFSQI